MGEKAAIFNPLFHYSLLKLTIPFLEIPPWLCRRFRPALANIDAMRTADAGIGAGYERNNCGKAKACRAPCITASANGDPSLPLPRHHARWQYPANATADVPGQKIDPSHRFSAGIRTAAAGGDDGPLPFAIFSYRAFTDP
ncbi:hypothetical protein ACI2KT_05985 [Ensifer adhaerens]|uniref:hypothetical protein n=1 Tax=Ensifer adhaerens TaxID=106592 RepID=UPI00384B4AA5